MSARGLFPRLLGEDWAALPESVRRAHAGTGAVALRGRARAVGASGAAALVRGLQGLPSPGPHPTWVTIASDGRTERWTRRFGPRRFSSTLAPAKDAPGAFEERAGLATYRFTLQARPDGFAWIFRSWRLGPIPLPRAWAPRIRARIFARDDGAYRFRILVAHPWLGVIFGYAGRLTWDEA